MDADQLLISDSQSRRLTDGVVRQLRPLTPGQPWGIFIVEFTGDFFQRGALREILRGLVANRRRDPSLPAWQHANLLFICATHDPEYEQITFAHYRGEKAQKARLATFGWRIGSPYVRTQCEFNLPALLWPENPERRSFAAPRPFLPAMSGDIVGLAFTPSFWHFAESVWCG